MNLAKKLLLEKRIQDDVAKTIDGYKLKVKNIINRSDPRMLVLVGPCSIHNIDQAKVYANYLAELQLKFQDKLFVVMRAYLEKPRTSTGWKGFITDPDINGKCDIYKGLLQSITLYKYIAELGLPIGTEILDPFIVPYLEEYMTWACIGARTTESQIHRQMASKFTQVVGFKNATNGDLNVAVNAINTAKQQHKYVGFTRHGELDVIETSGNKYCHLVLRGGSNAPNYSVSNLSKATETLISNNCSTSIMIDCSHGNSNYSYERQSIVLKSIIDQRQAGNKSIVGFMLESNIKSGKQKIPENKSELKYGISVTDECIDLLETQKLLQYAYDRL